MSEYKVLISKFEEPYVGPILVDSPVSFKSNAIEIDLYNTSNKDLFKLLKNRDHLFMISIFHCHSGNASIGWIDPDSGQIYNLVGSFPASYDGYKERKSILEFTPITEPLHIINFYKNQ